MTATRKKSPPAAEAPSFRQAYEVLQRHAETLRNQREPNIDDLLRIVTESVDAYKVCRERIDAVEAALEQALAGAVEGAGDAPDDGTRRPRPSASDEADDGEDDDDDLDDDPVR